MWDTLRDLGFEGGDVLEPGAGSGTFIGMAPGSARMVGVELDPTTASIARGLYPDAEIRTESFAESRFPAAASTPRSATCRSPTHGSMTRSSTRTATRCTTTSS